MTAVRTRTGLLLAVVATGAVALQLVLSMRMAMANGRSAIDGVVVFLGYFTVLTNLLVALVAAAPWMGRGRLTQRLGSDGMLGCATTSILLVGIAYHLLLRHVWNPQGLQWLADMLLHYAVPALALVHWIATCKQRRLTWLAPLAWCAWPALYLVYALLRGVTIGGYPYPFIDVDTLGYAAVGRNAVGLLLAFGVLAVAVRAMVSSREGAL